VRCQYIIIFLLLFSPTKNQTGEKKPTSWQGMDIMLVCVIYIYCRVGSYKWLKVWQRESSQFCRTFLSETTTCPNKTIALSIAAHTNTHTHTHTPSPDLFKIPQIDPKRQLCSENIQQTELQWWMIYII